MKFLSLLTLASMAVAAPAGEKRAPTPLDVKLELVGNSEVKATVTNTGKNNLKLFKTGTFLDGAPVEKVQVASGDEAVAFDGVRLLMQTSDLAEDSFKSISSGESISVTFDVAELHDLSTGGTFSISSSGAFSFAEGDSTELTGSVGFNSNSIDAEVDGEAAAAVHSSFQKKRTTIQSGCTSSQQSAVTTALSNCVSLATTGYNAANSGSDAKMTEFFKSASSSTRSTVAGVFSRIRTDCGSTSGGYSRTYCTDFYSSCSSGVIAYTLPSASSIAYCPIFFNQLPATSTGCYTQTRANTVVHEETHLTQVKGTSDYGGYGYSFVRSLTAAQNLNHADTYALFVQSIYAGC